MAVKDKTETKTTTTFLIMMGMSTAFLLVTPVLILLLIGFFTDKFFHTTPFFMLLGIAIGIIGGTFNVFRLLQAMQRNKSKVKSTIKN
jgi:F0F1-type ATP synthase assembly protein I